VTSSARPTPPYDGPERRAESRLPASALPHLSAHVIGEAPVRLVDISKRGARLESSARLPTGSTLTIRFIANGEAQVLTGAVVRDTVVVLETSGEVTYHIALAFTDELTLCGDDFASAQTPDAAPSLPHPADTEHDYTMLVFDRRIGAPPGAPAGAAC
jgi:hypothetical protein